MRAARAALLAYGLLNAALYAGLLPLWEGWDEPFHYGCVQEISRQGRLPVLGRAVISREIWDSLEHNIGCQVIQNNFEVPPYAILGNMDAVAPGALSRFLMQLNIAFAQETAKRPRVILQDVHGISANMGTRQWFDWNRYFSYKLLLTPEANLELARSLSSIVKAMYGKSRKVLVLDLDNTLWGGVIGDDGVDNGGDPTPRPGASQNPQIWDGRDVLWPTPATAEEAEISLRLEHKDR